MKIKLDEGFTTLNVYINGERRNRYIGAKIKKEETDKAQKYFEGVKVPTPCIIHFTWYLTNKRKDPDNISFAKKFILDGMTKAEAIQNDTLQYIRGFSDSYKFDDHEWVELEFEEVGEQ